MAWLIAHANALFNFIEERDDANALEELRALLVEKPLADGTDDPVQLLEKLKQSERIGGLDVLPPALLDRLKIWYAKASTANPEINRLRSLLSPLGIVCAAKKDRLDPVLWPLDAAISGTVDDIRLQASLNGQAQIKLVVCPPLPAKAGSLPAGSEALLFNIEGQLDVDAGAKLPMGHFAVALNSSTQGTLSCNYYSLHASGMRFAPAVAAGLSRIEISPFDLVAISARFKYRELHCITLAGEGNLSLGGRIALATPLTLAGNSKLADLAYGYVATLRGQFDYLLRADDTQSDKVLLFLNRRRGSGQNQDAVAKVGVDLTSAYARIKAETTPLLKKAGAILEMAEELLAPGALIQRELKEAISDLDPDSAMILGPALESLFGFQSGSRAVEAFKKALSDEIAARFLDVEGDLEQASTLALDGVLIRLGLSSAQRVVLAAKLKDQVKRALANIRAHVDAKITEVADSPEIEVLKASLLEIGEQFQNHLGEQDARLAAVRLLVKRYREMTAKFYATLEGVTELKVEASLRRVVEHTRENAADLVLRFDPTNEKARTTFRHALLGSFANVLELANGSDGVEVLDCHLRRVLVDTSENTLDVSVLGFTLVGGSLLNKATTIDTDASGNVAVMSTAAFARRRALGGESKTIRFADVFEVVSAHKTRNLTLNATLSYEDTKLDLSEATGFFESLVTAGLLGRGVLENASRFLSEADINTPVANHAGRLDVSLLLTGADLEKFLGVGENIISYSQHVREVSAEEMANAYIALQPEDKKTSEAWILDRLKAYSTCSTLKDTILCFDNDRLNSGPGVSPANSRSWNHAIELNRMHDLCIELGEAIAAIRNLYETTDAALAEWTAETYQKKQEEIMRIKDVVPGDFPSLFGPEKVRPKTVALYRILARLAGRLPSSGQSDVLIASMILGSGNSKRVKLLV